MLKSEFVPPTREYPGQYKFYHVDETTHKLIDEQIEEDHDIYWDPNSKGKFRLQMMKKCFPDDNGLMQVKVFIDLHYVRITLKVSGVTLKLCDVVSESVDSKFAVWSVKASDIYHM